MPKSEKFCMNLTKNEKEYTPIFVVSPSISNFIYPPPNSKIESNIFT